MQYASTNICFSCKQSQFHRRMLKTLVVGTRLWKKNNIFFKRKYLFFITSVLCMGAFVVMNVTLHCAIALSIYLGCAGKQDFLTYNEAFVVNTFMYLDRSRKSIWYMYILLLSTWPQSKHDISKNKTSAKSN